MASVQIKRGTRAQIEAAKTANGLLNGEPYLITDESRLAVGTATNAYSDCAKKSEVDGKEPALGNPASDGQVLSSTAAGVRSWTAVSGGGGPTITAVATGSISNGASVAVNTDGTVSVVAGATGMPAVFNSASTQSLASCFDSTNNKVVIAYIDAGNSNYGTAIVGTVSGTSISFGSEVVFNSAATDYISCAFDSSSGKVVIAYKDGGNSNYGTAIVGTVSGTSISFGSEVVFNSAATYYSTICAVGSSKVVIGYSPGNYGYAIVGTVSGTSISFGTGTQCSGQYNTTLLSCCYDTSASRVVICFVGNSYYSNAVIGTVSGTSISFGTPVVLMSESTGRIVCCFDSTNNKVVIGVAQGNAIRAFVGTVSGTTISFNPAKPVGVYLFTGSTVLTIVFNPTLGKVVFFACVYSSPYKMFVSLGTVSGADISFGTAVDTGFTAVYYNLSSCFDSSNNKVIVLVPEYTNGDYGTAGVFIDTVGSNYQRFIGFADDTYANGETATIAVVGNTDDAQSGLTAGTKYYVGQQGGLNTASANPYAGIALSATKLLIKG